MVSSATAIRNPLSGTADGPVGLTRFSVDVNFHFSLQVFLGPHGEVEEYAVLPIQPNAEISSELILDQSEEHIYIMTNTMVSNTKCSRLQDFVHVYQPCDLKDLNFIKYKNVIFLYIYCVQALL